MFLSTEGRGTGGCDFPPRDGEDVPFHRRKGTKGRWGTFDVPQTPDDRLLRGAAAPWPWRAYPRGRGILCRNILPEKYELRALRRLKSR